MKVETAYLAWQFAMAIGSEMDEVLEPLGLTKAQFNALQHMADTPGITSAEAARRTGITAQSMGAAVADLADRGLARREPHPVHRRLIALTLTPRGEQAMWRAMAAVSEINVRALAPLDDGQRDTLRSILLQLVHEKRPEVIPGSGYRVSPDSRPPSGETR